MPTRAVWRIPVTVVGVGVGLCAIEVNLTSITVLLLSSRGIFVALLGITESSGRSDTRDAYTEGHGLYLRRSAATGYCQSWGSRLL